MYHAKIDTAVAVAIPSAKLDAPIPTQPLGTVAWIHAVLIVLGLPLILLWLLARFVWNDLKAIARGLAIFCRTVAAELSRS